MPKAATQRCLFHACTYGCTTLRDVVRDAKSFDEIFHAWGVYAAALIATKNISRQKEKTNKIKEGGFLFFA